MPSPALVGAEERGGPCLEEAVGVKRGSHRDPEEPRVSTEERCLGKAKLLSPDTCRAVLQQRGKTGSPKPELGLVGRQNGSKEELLTAKLPSPSGRWSAASHRGCPGGHGSPGLLGRLGVLGLAVLPGQPVLLALWPSTDHFPAVSLHPLPAPWWGVTVSKPEVCPGQPQDVAGLGRGSSGPSTQRDCLGSPTAT